MLKGVKSLFRKDSFFGQLTLKGGSQLEEGFNKNVLVAGKIVQIVSKEGEIP